MRVPARDVMEGVQGIAKGERLGCPHRGREAPTPSRGGTARQFAGYFSSLPASSAWDVHNMFLPDLTGIGRGVVRRWAGAMLGRGINSSPR